MKLAAAWPDAAVCPNGPTSGEARATCVLLGATAGMMALELPMVVTKAGCGFPSPAGDHAEARLDLTQLLVPRPAATYMLRASGSSMRRAGILDGAVLICDRSKEAVHGDIVVAAVEDNLVVKRLWARDGVVELRSDPDPEEAGEHPPIRIQDGMQFIVWGPVTGLAMMFHR